jgi:TPP-dependent pyruvate/acetoin dehydrogenase alpha subunit
MIKKFVALDFHEHDSAEALNYLMSLVQNDQMTGMVFAVSIKRGRSLFGATGRVASNLPEAAGLASMLQHQMCRNALEP